VFIGAFQRRKGRAFSIDIGKLTIENGGFTFEIQQFN